MIKTIHLRLYGLHTKTLVIRRVLNNCFEDPHYLVKKK